jgi:hypothetical protein
VDTIGAFFVKLTVDEQIERTRQAIMRYRELLDLMRDQLEEGETLYRRMFDGCNLEELAGLKEKEQQLQAAYTLFEDPTSIAAAALHMAFSSRNLERDFHQIHDNVMVP